MIEEKLLPLVSVVIPCYNHENFIKEAIVSIVNQTYQNIELIIIDDGSKDGSVDVIKQMLSACEERFVRFEFRHRANKGLSATLNEGISWCNGEFISFCSSDDALHVDKIKYQIDYFDKNHNSDFCYTGTYIFDDNSNILDKQTELINKSLPNKVEFEDIFTFKVHFPVTGMYRTKFMVSILGGFDEKLSAEDYDINLRIIENTEVGFIDKKLYFYRSPEAIGQDRKRYVMRRDVSESHLATINKYKNHKAYKQALLEWNFRRFVFFSAYKATKFYSIKGMLQSIGKIKNKSFFSALFRLFFYWK